MCIKGIGNKKNMQPRLSIMIIIMYLCTTQIQVNVTSKVLASVSWLFSRKLATILEYLKNDPSSFNSSQLSTCWFELIACVIVSYTRLLYMSIGPPIFKHSHLYLCKSINLHLSSTVYKCITFFSNFTYTLTVVLLINWLTREHGSQIYLSFGQLLNIKALD